jgi:hypothetical protein
MGWNQGYQDGLGGMSKPSNGDWGSFSAGHSARQEKQFWDGLEQQRRQAQSASPSNSWSMSTTSTPPPAYGGSYAAGDAVDWGAFGAVIKFGAQLAWLVVVFVLLVALVTGIVWLPRALILGLATVGRLPGRRGMAFVRRVLDPCYRATESSEAFLCDVAAFALGQSDSAKESSD